MAVTKNVVVVLSRDEASGLVAIQRGIETNFLDESTFRNALENSTDLSRLFCLMAINLENAAVQPLSATWETLMTQLSGKNYKI